MTTDVDALVLGGGQAGTAAAQMLARAGLRVVVVERSAYDRPRIGETLPPASQRWLRELGVWERFRAAGHLPSSGVVSCWGSETEDETDFFFNPFGSGWHLDRTRFDRLLADAARGAGAEVCMGCRVREARQDAGLWHVETDGDDGPRCITSRWLVNACGRSSASGLKGTRRRMDRLVGVALFGRMQENDDDRLYLEAVASGWWYATPLPDARCVFVYLTDVDLLPDLSDDRLAGFRWQIEQTTLIRKRWQKCVVDGTPRAFNAGTYLAEPIVADHFLAVGDAASAFDPLSSEGLSKAATSGISAARAILRAETGDALALVEYAARVTTEFQTYLTRRSFYYGRERRWPASTFWQLRHLPPAAGAYGS